MNTKVSAMLKSTIAITAAGLLMACQPKPEDSDMATTAPSENAY